MFNHALEFFFLLLYFSGLSRRVWWYVMIIRMMFLGNFPSMVDFIHDTVDKIGGMQSVGSPAGIQSPDVKVVCAITMDASPDLSNYYNPSTVCRKHTQDPAGVLGQAPSASTVTHSSWRRRIQREVSRFSRLRVGPREARR
jgi:hypothetical protein